MIKNYLLAAAALMLLAGCGDDAGAPGGENGDGTAPPTIGNGDIAKLTDGKLDTYYESEGENVSFIVETNGQPIAAYTLCSAAGTSDTSDPQSWKMYGSVDKAAWTEIDFKQLISFWARFQERTFALNQPVTYPYIKWEVQPKDGKLLKLAEVKFHATDVNASWEKFKYPIINYVNEDKASKGSEYYDYMVQDKNEYLKYHAREVAKLLYFKASDPIEGIQMITYRLRDYDGVSGKSGSLPHVSIDFSTRHIAKSYQSSLFHLDAETRGVLFHEMTHCYQHEPKNCGVYQQGTIFWAFIEGLADAVRAHAGYLSLANRKPGGWYTDGYQTTGFFIQWLTTKDPDAIRKFNASARELDTWTFDAAMVYVFGKEVTAKELWNEYQEFLKKQVI